MLGAFISFIFWLLIIYALYKLFSILIETRKEVDDLHFKLDLALKLIEKIPKEEGSIKMHHQEEMKK